MSSLLCALISAGVHPYLSERSSMMTISEGGLVPFSSASQVLFPIFF